MPRGFYHQSIRLIWLRRFGNFQPLMTALGRPSLRALHDRDMNECKLSIANRFHRISLPRFLYFRLLMTARGSRAMGARHGRDGR